MAEAIRYECMHSKNMPSGYRHFANPGMSPSPVYAPKREAPMDIVDYDILGPLPVGKLEVCCTTLSLSLYPTHTMNPNTLLRIYI